MAELNRPVPSVRTLVGPEPPPCRADGPPVAGAAPRADGNWTVSNTQQDSIDARSVPATSADVDSVTRAVSANIGAGEGGAAASPAVSAAGAVPQSRSTLSPAASSRTTDNDEPAPLVDLGPVLRESPPWLISAVIHMVVLICLGLLFAATTEEVRLLLDVTYAEDTGEQLLEDNLKLAPETEIEFDEQIITPEHLPEVLDPLATPAMTDISPNPTELTSAIAPTTIGLALTGREHGMKQALLKAYGGNALTEGAVTLGLKWLARQQRSNGMWSLKGPYSDGASAENTEAATAMALLAFQGAGHTHQGDKQNPFTAVATKGWRALRKRQGDNGCFFQDGPYNHHFYTHAQCTIGICELYGMTGDPDLRKPAQRAVDYLVQTQTSEGGWRYNPGSDSDLSVTGWVVMALQSARMAGLEVPSETFDRIRRFLDLVAKNYGAEYAYRPREGARVSMTAEGLLCRQYLGWAHDDPRLRDGVETLLNRLPSWERGERNVYYWYYATQVCHHMEGDWWRRWNEVMRDLLPAHQQTKGRERGSWDPDGDRWGPHGGRLYVTCLSLYMLEVYYRHLPIYQKGLLQ